MKNFFLNIAVGLLVLAAIATIISGALALYYMAFLYPAVGWVMGGMIVLFMAWGFGLAVREAW